MFRVGASPESVLGQKKLRRVPVGGRAALKSLRNCNLRWAIEELNLGPHAYQACALTT